MRWQLNPFSCLTLAASLTAVAYSVRTWMRLRDQERHSSLVSTRSMYDIAPWTVRRWYFELRLAEEIQRCLRYSEAMTVANLHLPVDLSPGMEPAAIAHAVARALRPYDIVAYLGPSTYAICLVHCDRDTAAMVVTRVLGALEAPSASVGLAECPEDGTDAGTLLKVAQEDSHQWPANQEAA